MDATLTFEQDVRDWKVIWVDFYTANGSFIRLLGG